MAMSDTTRIAAAPYNGSCNVLGHTVYIWSYTLPSDRIGYTYSVNVNGVRITSCEVYSTAGQALSAATEYLTHC